MTLSREIILFLMIGAAGFVVDAGGVHILTRYADFHPIIARLPGFAAAICVTFFLHDRLTFNGSRSKALVPAFIHYIAANILSQSTNFALYSVLVWGVSFFRDFPEAAVAVGSIVAAALSFTLYKKVVFKDHGKAS